MTNKKPFLVHVLLASGIAIATPASFACSSCGCTLSSDWDSQGYAVTPGVRIDVRYDYLDQSQLRSGTGTVDRASIALPAEREIEQGTKNQYTTIELDYSPSKN
jgi:hypothetical protein